MLVYGGTKFMKEITRSDRVSRWFAQLVRAGNAVSIDRAAVDGEEARLCAARTCRSDDEHIIALARVTGARVICTEDEALFHDFRDRTLITKPRGRVYRKASHVSLLKHDSGCQKPPARGRRRRRRRR
jgi:hypothetical protein